MSHRQSGNKFRLALETLEDVKSQLIGLTKEAKKISETVDNMKSAVQKKRKEVQRLVKKVAGRRRSLRALEKRSRKAATESRMNSGQAFVPGDSVDVLDTTFVIEEINISMAESEAASARKRKRFAGIWNAPSISSETLQANEDRRKRPCRDIAASESSWTSITGVENDENLVPPR